MSSGRDTLALIVVGVIVAFVVVAVGIGVLGGTSVSTSSGPAVVADALEPPEDGSAGMVFDLHTTEGMSLFGIKLQADKHRMHAGFIAPPECVQRDESGSEVLLSDGACADLPVRGEVTGGGTTRGGLTLVIVQVDVSRECYETLERGDPWPATQAECTQS